MKTPKAPKAVAKDPKAMAEDPKGPRAIGSERSKQRASHWQQASHWQHMRWHLRHGVPT
jgi:hypothetical protein